MANESDQNRGRPPQAQPAWTVDARAGAACQAEVIQTLERLLGLLQTGGQPPSPGAVGAVNRRFGKDLPAALQATADMMQGCITPFQYLPFCAATLRQLEVRIRVLQNSKASLDEASAALANELSACRVQAAHCVDGALRTLRSTLDNPGAPPQLQRPLLQASQPLRSLLASRAQEVPAQGLGSSPKDALALPAAAAARRRGRRPL